MTVFGLQWTQATDAYVRPAESVLTSLTPATTVAQCNTYAPWSGMRRCNLWDDGTPTAYYGDRCYTDTDVANMGQVMVQIPKFWYCTDHGGGVYKWWISTTGADAVPAGADGGAWKVYPSFTRDAATRAYIYLGAYEAYLNGTKLESVSGVLPKTTYSNLQFRAAAQARASGAVANKWEMQDYLATCAVQLLYLVEYGNFNAQTILGRGYTGAIAIQLTGATATGGAYASGNASYGLPGIAGGDGTKPVSYRGIENLYGNTQTYVDGLNIKADRDPWIADHDFDSTNVAGHPYVHSTATPLSATADDYIANIKVDTTFDYGFLPSVAGGAGTSSSTLIPDQYVSAAGPAIRVANYGGAVTQGSSAGPFTWWLNSASGNADASIGSRLMYMG